MNTKTEKTEAISQLRKLVKPGRTVYGIIRHVSSSGMTRNIDFYVIHKGEPYFLTYYIGKALGYRHDYRGRGGLVVQGCGMDMVFSVVYDLGRTLWPKGFTPARHKLHGRNGSPATEHDSDGGYALRSQVL